MCGTSCTRTLWRWAATDRGLRFYSFTRARVMHISRREKKHREWERGWKSAKRVRYLRHRNALVKMRPKVRGRGQNTIASPSDERAKRLYSCLNTTTKNIICAFDVTCELVMTSYCITLCMLLSRAGGREGYYQLNHSANIIKSISRNALLVGL